MRLLFAFVFFAGGVLASGLVQEQTGLIRIGGAQNGWVTQTVSDSGPDTTYYWRSTGNPDEVIASERRVAQMIAAAMPSPMPTPTATPTPTPTPPASPTPTPTPAPTPQCVRFNRQGKCIRWA